MIVSETSPTDRESIKACLFPNEGFREAIRESVETEGDNKRVEPNFQS